MLGIEAELFFRQNWVFALSIQKGENKCSILKVVERSLSSISYLEIMFKAVFFLVTRVGIEGVNLKPTLFGMKILLTTYGRIH